MMLLHASQIRPAQALIWDMSNIESPHKNILHVYMFELKQSLLVFVQIQSSYSSLTRFTVPSVLFICLNTVWIKLNTGLIRTRAVSVIIFWVL